MLCKSDVLAIPREGGKLVADAWGNGKQREVTRIQYLNPWSDGRLAPRGFLFFTQKIFCLSLT